MGSWPNQGKKSSDNSCGGRQRPPYDAFCASCGKRNSTANMTVETGNNGACGYLVCTDCFDGPPPDNRKPDKTDNTGPIDNIFY